MENAPESPAYGALAKDRAAFWGVSLRTMQKWLAATPPVPVEDTVAMVRWVANMPRASQNKLRSSFLARIHEERLKLERTPANPPPPSGGSGTAPLDPLYQEFLLTQAAAAPRDASMLADLKREGAYAVFKLQRAHQRNDLPAIQQATETVRYIAGIIHDEELRAQKLGKEVGDILPRAEVERILRAIVYWLLRAVDNLLAVLSKRIAAQAATGPLHPEEVRLILEPELLSSRILEPFARAAAINAGTSLPRWTVDAMREALAATLDTTDALFATLYAAPVIPSPMPFADGDGI